jgi:hypothetical protein
MMMMHKCCSAAFSKHKHAEFMKTYGYFRDGKVLSRKFYGENFPLWKTFSKTKENMKKIPTIVILFLLLSKSPVFACGKLITVRRRKNPKEILNSIK